MNDITALYNDEVLVKFNERSHRYDVSVDGGTTWAGKPGVTGTLNTLAKEGLMLWPMNMALSHIKTNLKDLKDLENCLAEAAKAHTRKSDKGKDVGHEAHAMVEQFLRSKMTGEEPHYVQSSPEAHKAFVAFQSWYDGQEDIKVLGVEKVVYSQSGDYCGTFDCLLKIDGKIVLCDLKTTNPSRDAPLGIYPEYFLQLGAYCLAHVEDQLYGTDTPTEEELDAQVADLMIINCSKQGKVSTLRASELGLSVGECIGQFLNVVSLTRFLTPLKKVIKERK